jgi:hypothetical protein
MLQKVPRRRGGGRHEGGVWLSNQMLALSVSTSSCAVLQCIQSVQSMYRAVNSYPRSFFLINIYVRTADVTGINRIRNLFYLLNFFDTMSEMTSDSRAFKNK